MYCKSQGAEVTTSYFEGGGLIVWQEYEKNIMIIGIAKGLTEKVLRLLVDYSFRAMIFTVGHNEIKTIRNLDRLKRDLKPACFLLIDRLLEAAENELLEYNEALMCTEGTSLDVKLQEYSQEIASPFCCLLIRQRIASATEAFWDLHVKDRKLLLYMLSISSTLEKDSPVYLPMRSPHVRFNPVFDFR
jgi:protein fuzzy